MILLVVPAKIPTLLFNLMFPSFDGEKYPV
jgi:hypothetical protein